MDAKILPFRRNDRRTPCPASGGRSRTVARPPLPALPVEHGSGWYHDAAIKDHERSIRNED